MYPEYLFHFRIPTETVAVESRTIYTNSHMMYNGHISGVC